MEKNKDEINYLKKLGDKISERRIELNLNPGELAEKVGLTRMQIYRIESGETSSTIIVLRRLAKALQLKLTELVNME